MDLFLLKKIISALIMPLSIVLLLLLIAIVFYKRNHKLSFIALFCATFLLFISSFAPFSNKVMAPLENKYPSFTHSPKPLDYIIILGCSHIDDASLPATGELSVCSLQRLVEAIRIYNMHPEATLIASGYAGSNEVSNAEKVKQAAILLGIPEVKILTENFPQDTEEEAELIAPRVQGKNVALITNADHLPRAMQYFNQHGVSAIPAPASPKVKYNNQQTTWQYFVPRAHTLAQTTTAWYEYLGLTVQWLKNMF